MADRDRLTDEDMHKIKRSRVWAPLARRHAAALALAVMAVATGTVRSAQAELDPDVMLAIEDLNKSLSSNIALKDAKASTADAKELETLFAKVEVFFVEKGEAPDAVDLSKKSRTLSNAIIKNVESGNFEGATDAATDLSRTCRACHTFYKKS
ncbi:MAG: hypothetical protein ACOZE7_17750 [Pseudomonadota bacterium]|jgi:hypothetical protein